MGLWQAVAEARQAVHPLTAEEATLPQNQGVSHFAWHAGQNLTARFMADGVRIAAGDEESATVTFRYEGTKGSSVLGVEGARAEYQHPDGVREWFENGEAGIEHGFTLAHRLENAGASGIHLDVRLAGLTAVPGAHADELLLQGSDGVPRLRYAGLKAWDADGDPLVASMAPTGEGIRLAVNDQGARYPLTIDPVLTNLSQSLRPEIGGDVAPKNHFGESIALGTGFVLVGSPNSITPAGIQSGVAYVFSGGGASWKLQARLHPPGIAANDHFGKEVDIEESGTRVVISSPDAASEGIAGAGKVFVFKRSGTIWTLEDTLEPGTGIDTHFGDSVAIWGSTVAVGSPFEYQERGAVSIYTLANNNWLFRRKVTGPENITDRHFGAAIDLHRGALLVGAPDSGTGSAYLFQGGEWTRRAVLPPVGTPANSRFGCSVDVEPIRLIVGAYNYKDAMPSSGAAFVYPLSVGVPGAPATLRPDPVASESGFGTSVAIFNDQAVVGACDYPRVSSDQGSVYAFSLFGETTWTRRNRFQLGGDSAKSSFGAKVAMGGRVEMLISAPTHGSFGRSASGAVSVYSFAGRSTWWDLKAELNAGSGQIGAELGASVAIEGATAMIGAPGAFTAAGGASAGEVYVMNRQGEAWEVQQRLTGGSPLGGERFGATLDLDGDTAMIGAPDYDQPATNQGAAYIFTRENEVWSKQTQLIAPEPETSQRFGRVIALSGDTAAVGLPSSVMDESVVQIFTRSGGEWSAGEVVKLSHEDEVESFGSAVALEGNTLLVGAPAAFGSSVESSAHVFTRSDSVWTRQATLKAVKDGFDIGLGFGSAVALSGDTALIGAPDDFPIADRSRGFGRAYFFKRTGSNWAVEDTVYSGEGPHSDRFGTDVALDGDVAVIGAQYSKTPQYRARHLSACIFTRDNGRWERQRVHETKDAEGLIAIPEHGSSVAVDGNHVLVGVSDTPGTNPVGQSVSDAGQVDFIDLIPKEEVFLAEVDTDLDGGISLDEWGAFHGVTRKTRKDFQAVDTDGSGSITLEEIQAATTSRPAAQLRNSIERTRLFMELDVDKDLLVTRVEIEAMYLPGTDATAIDAFWSRAGASEGFDLQTWIGAETLPSTKTYETARQQREKRLALVLEHDANEDEAVQFEEFREMFPGIKTSKAEALWRIARGLSRRAPIEGEIPQEDFVNTVKLPIFR